MSPISGDTSWASSSPPGNILMARVFNNTETSEVMELDAHQVYVLRVLATTASSFSVASAIVAFYWFVKMRRSFRHHLIMLLIQSDMMKALWYMIHPIVAFIHGDVPTTSSFCQASGFFIALSIEASDFAILMIAIHTALYIWKPSPSIGEGGLYPYRHLAYVMWVIFPALSAGLAFVNPDHAYTSQGTYCYLPVRPLWYPVGLAWTPRYIIFITISTIYIAIYAYVHYKFNDLDSNMGHSYMEENATALNEINAGVDYDPRAMDPQLEIPTTPPLPTLTRHGLIPSNTPSAVDPNSRKASIASNDNVRPVSQGSDWVDQAFGGLDTRLKSGLQAERPTNLEASQFNSLRNIPGTSEASPPSDNHSFVGILHALRNGNDPTPDTPIHHQPQLGLPSDATLTLVDSQGYTGATEELHQKRIAIRRQLRFLFIYPLVYMFMWIIPFISHVLQYTNWYVRNPSLALTALVTVIVPLQCAVDSWLFSTREKPWRYIPGSRGTFFSSFLFWTHDQASEAAGKSTVPVSRTGPGKSRAEMAAEARVAYKRREEELARGAKELTERQNARKMSLVRRSGQDRSWWEEEGKRRQDSVFMDLTSTGDGLVEVEEGEPSPSTPSTPPTSSPTDLRRPALVLSADNMKEIQ